MEKLKKTKALVLYLLMVFLFITTFSCSDGTILQGLTTNTNVTVNTNTNTNITTNTLSTYSTMTLRGSMNDWSTSDMTLISNYCWQITLFLDEGSYEFKFGVSSDWSRPNWGDDDGDGIGDRSGENIPLNCLSGNVTITFNDNTSEYYVDAILNPFRKLPYLILGTNIDQMTVLWQAIETYSNTQIYWGTNPEYAFTNDITEFGDDHQYQYTFSGLSLKTRIYYHVSMGGKCYSNSFISQPPANLSNLTFYAYGDPRNNPSCQDTVLYRLLNDVDQNADTNQTVMLMTGDWLDHSDEESEWDSGFFNTSYTNTTECFMRIPLMGVKGNHEMNDDILRKYYPYNYQDDEACYYSIDYGPIHVVYIDQYVPYNEGSVQHTWISNDLSASTKKWKIAIFHEPGWCPGGGYHEPNTEVQTNLQPLFLTTGVRLVFNAHCHYYSRSMVDGIAHIVTAGAGGGFHNPEPGYPNVVTYTVAHHFCRVDITDDILKLTAIDDEGSVIDSFNLTNGIM